MLKMIPAMSVYQDRDKQGKQHFMAHLNADKASELARVTEDSSRIFDFGSTALTADGKLCLLDSKGVWHNLRTGEVIA